MASREVRFFDRDISWLSFNKRVLEEGLDKSVPIYERLNFLSIFSSNLEEFYQVRMASNRAALHAAIKAGKLEDVLKKREHFDRITEEVKRQEELFRQAWEEVMVPDLLKMGVKIYTHAEEMKGEVRHYVERYFEEEVFPYLQPVLVSPEALNVFVRDKRVYLAVYVKRHSDGRKQLFMIKLPFTKAPRFLSIPVEKGRFAFTFLDEVIRAGLDKIFVEYDVIGSYSFKVSRDADIDLDDERGGEWLAESIEEQIAKRKTGAVTRLQFDDMMPTGILEQLVQSMNLPPEVLLPSRRHLQLQDLRKLPNPLGSKYAQQYHIPVPQYRWNTCLSRIEHLLKQDEAIYVPYTSFQYLLDTLHEACNDPRVKAIKLTQYRVAEESEVIDVLIKAANSGKEVTVFVELKARFDEENNLQTAHWMIRHGVKIIYSLPRLKVHAKTCLIEFHPDAVPGKSGIACFSTGNFNEKTAKLYTDILLFTSRNELTRDLSELFHLLEWGKTEHTFEHLLVASHGMVEQIHDLIEYEIAEAKAGREARMVLKMNSIEEQGVIEKLYEASLAGVQIDLLVRGICRVIPEQPYSRNIRIIRLIDIYLEHARIWYFYHGGEERYYISSADWMTRNLYRRIESGAPVWDPTIKNFLKELLQLCLDDNVKATYLTQGLENSPKRDHPERTVRTQKDMYEVVKHFNQLPPFTLGSQRESATVEQMAIGETQEQVQVPHLERSPRNKKSWLSQFLFRKKR